MQCPAALAARRLAPRLCFCLGLVLWSLLSLGSPALGMIGTIDAVPAATLLLPYFEVNTAPTGMNTLFSINNASPFAVLAHVTVWTDQSIPALDFDVYLTGYDVQILNLRDIFVNGNLPRTASAGQDPTDTISPQGPVSQDINFSSCSSLPYPTGAISAAFRAHLQAWFQGNISPATGNCAGSKQPDTNVLRGYVTVDTVNACNLFFPSDWAFYEPFVTDQNVLWGDVSYVDPSRGISRGDTLVHIEACSFCFLPGDHTFYGRYNGVSAVDAREPLPTTMAARYLNSGGPSNATTFLIWREANESDSAYSCALQGPPGWYPLQCTQILLFDEQEHLVNNGCPGPWVPNEANRTNVNSNLLSPFNAGWVYLNLQHPASAYPDPYAQMWLTTTMDNSSVTGVALSGIQLDNANAPNSDLIPFP